MKRFDVCSVFVPYGTPDYEPGVEESARGEYVSAKDVKTELIRILAIPDDDEAFEQMETLIGELT